MRLIQLGVKSPDIIRDAVQHGAGTARSASTPHHPANYAGMRMWAETLYALADQASPYGWRCESFKGVDMVTNHETGIAILVTAGDGATGEPHYSPDALYERPEMVRAIVSGALDTMWDAERGRALKWQAWMLLHNRHAAAEGIIPAELSLPATITKDGHVLSWTERLLISADRPLDGDRQLEATSPRTPAPVVQVRRRAS